MQLFYTYHFPPALFAVLSEQLNTEEKIIFVYEFIITYNFLSVNIFLRSDKKQEKREGMEAFPYGIMFKFCPVLRCFPVSVGVDVPGDPLQEVIPRLCRDRRPRLSVK